MTTPIRSSFICRTVSIVCCMTLLSGCANTSANLQRETARFIGNMSSEQVVVSDIERRMTKVSWMAETPNGVYTCEADDMMRRVNCVKE